MSKIFSVGLLGRAHHRLMTGHSCERRRTWRTGRAWRRTLESTRVEARCSKSRWRRDRPIVGWVAGHWSKGIEHQLSFQKLQELNVRICEADSASRLLEKPWSLAESSQIVKTERLIEDPRAALSRKVPLQTKPVTPLICPNQFLSLRTGPYLHGCHHLGNRHLA